MFSNLPAQAQRATWSPLRASKEPFKHHISSHTVKPQPGLVGQQDHHTSTHSSTCTLPTPHLALPGFAARALTHTSGGPAQFWWCSLGPGSMEGNHCKCCALFSLCSSWGVWSLCTLCSSCPFMPSLSDAHWHGKYVFSANVIHSLIKPPWKGGIFFCDLLRVICTDLLRCSSGCCHSILSARKTGRCCGEGNGFCWKNWLYWCILKSASPLELPSLPSSMAGRVSWEPACSVCCQGPGCAGEIHLLCLWEPTSPSLASLAVQTYLDLKEAAHC